MTLLEVIERIIRDEIPEEKMRHYYFNDKNEMNKKFHELNSKKATNYTLTLTLK